MGNQYTNPYVTPMSAVSHAAPKVRGEFIRKTYLHLAGAILAFGLLEALLFATGLGQVIATAIFSFGNLGWILILGLFMVVSHIADRWASSDTSKGMQYLGLGIFVAAWAVMFLPILYVATQLPHFAASNVVMNAALVTLLLTAGLTVFAFVTKSDFSFLRGVLTIGGFVALGVIVASALFGFQLGMVFFGAMVLFASASILYTTSNIIHHYRPDQHVAASLALFSGVALLFWYILQIFMSRD